MRALENGDPRWIVASSGRYQVLARIGSGGMGTVYLGRSVGGRSVAIKVVHAAFAANREFRDRFRREVHAARSVSGAFSAPVIDADPDADFPWLVTEFLPSISLRDAVRDFGPLPPNAVWALAAGIGEALVSIHRAGIVHLDLKPANVLLTADGPRVIDFGISHAMEASAITSPGVPAGSAGFMSPEQTAGRRIGPPSDVFSLGSTLAYACTGAEPFGEGSAHVKMFRIDHDVPPLAGIADENLRIFLANCMIHEPTGRPTAEQLTGYLAWVTQQSRLAGTSWLPPAIVTEIDRRASEAENPPAVPALLDAPRPSVALPDRGSLSRRALLFGGIGAAAVLISGAAAVPAWLAIRAESPSPEPPATSPSPKPSPSPTAPPPSVEFYFSGSVRLLSLSITVNGKVTALKNVKLPWRMTFPLPVGFGKDVWRVAYTFPPGDILYRVLVNGSEVQMGTAGASGQNGHDDWTGYTYT